MKKFSTLKESSKVSNSQDDIKDLIIENISVLFEDIDEPWNDKINIEINESIDSILNQHVNKHFQKEKVMLLEKMRLSFYNNDITWLEDEIKKINS